jgi:hypothetical protein
LCDLALFFKPDSVKKEITAVQISTSLHIEGSLNDPEWRLAPNSPRFIQIEPYQGKDPDYEKICLTSQKSFSVTWNP